MGQFSIGSLENLLANNLVELIFNARSGKGSRRMLCTNNKRLLNSIAGKIALGFKAPKGVGLGYSPHSKNLVVTYDLFWQDFRQIPIESVNVVSAIPLKSQKDIDNFWEYFSRKLQDMSSSQKQVYMRR